MPMETGRGRPQRGREEKNEGERGSEVHLNPENKVQHAPQQSGGLFQDLILTYMSYAAW